MVCSFCKFYPFGNNVAGDNSYYTSVIFGTLVFCSYVQKCICKWKFLQTVVYVRIYRVKWKLLWEVNIAILWDDVKIKSSRHWARLIPCMRSSKQTYSQLKIDCFPPKFDWKFPKYQLTLSIISKNGNCVVT